MKDNGILPNCVEYARTQEEIERRWKEKHTKGEKKMRFIDADKLVDDIAEHITVKAVSRVLAIIQGQPTVETIPVEWIKKYCSEKLPDDTMDGYWHFFEEDTMKMIEEWEKENGRSK